MARSAVKRKIEAEARGSVLQGRRGAQNGALGERGIREVGNFGKRIGFSETLRVGHRGPWLDV